MIFSRKITLTTEWQMFVDITEEVKTVVAESGIKNGSVTVQTRHTTTGIKVMENEQLLLKDLEYMLERIAPKTIRYLHDDIEHRNVPNHERVNGHSHLKSFFLPASDTLLIVDGILALGQWQRVFLVECDPGRERMILVQAQGEQT